MNGCVLHGDVWCTCPPQYLTRKRQPFEGIDTANVPRRMGTCHECTDPFTKDEAMVTIFDAPRFNGGFKILHVDCAQRVLRRAPYKISKASSTRGGK